MKIVHFADLHLDSAFAWLGAAGDAARRRRQALRDVLRAIVKLARDEQADALFCGGDLYEGERAKQDTAADHSANSPCDTRPLRVGAPFR